MKKFVNFANNNGIKALVGIGGYNEGSTKYSQMVSTAAHREDFANSVVTFTQRFGFHGLALDWEYPTQRGGVPADRENYVLLLQTLKEKFASRGLLLTVGVGDKSISQWLSAGVPAQKMIMGIPLYGRTSHLADSSKHDLGASVTGPGSAGQVTQDPGLLAYFEYCTNPNWNVVHSSDGSYVYAYNSVYSEWINFDDADTVTVKAQYVKEKGLGGIMVYSLESEDFEGNCGYSYPILTAINKGLGRIQGIANFEVNNIDPKLCTHVVYAYTGLKNGVIASLDEYNDYEENWGKGNMKKFVNFANNNGIKALVGIGGYNEGSTKYSQMVSTAAHREDFANSVVTFTQRFGFHGLALDWEYPTQRGGVPADRDKSISQWLSAGVPAQKMILGIPLYGRTSHLADSSKHDLGASVTGPGSAGQVTQDPGLLAYFEYCTNPNWNVVHSSDGSYVYAYNSVYSEWISFDDADTVTVKAQYVKEMGLGGIMVYSLESEDFEGNCGYSYPILTAINKGLGRM
ncbi:hypothetical protein C0J52_02579 [Blattella germanica]|nr:hypothetical protein C0J52_02579 [Blattella germanica]